MKIGEYITLNYPNKKQTHYNVKSQLNEYFEFIGIKPEDYVNQNRDFKKDVLKYHSHLTSLMSRFCQYSYQQYSNI